MNFAGRKKKKKIVWLQIFGVYIIYHKVNLIPGGSDSSNRGVEGS